MPSVAPGGKILVTGGSGFVGAWIVKHLVDLGYTVIAAVRDEAKGEFLKNRFPEYAGKVTYAVVPDIEKEGAYDDAVKEADGIIHAASPVVWKWEDPSEVIGPAVNGATGILRSAKKYGPNVKRVIVTASSTSMVQSSKLGPAGRVYDETDYNGDSAKIVEQKGKQSSPWEVYAAAKALEERAVWDFVKTENPKFDATIVIPVWCWGPFIHEVSGGKGVGSTPAVFLGSFPAGDLTGDLLGSFVDVRDAALAHVLAITTEAAGGQRIVASNHTFSNQDMYDVLNKHNIAPGKVPGKDNKTRKMTPGTPHVSGTKALKLFPDFKYRSLDESITAMGEDFVKHGFL